MLAYNLLRSYSESFYMGQLQLLNGYVTELPTILDDFSTGKDTTTST